MISKEMYYLKFNSLFALPDGWAESFFAYENGMLLFLLIVVVISAKLYIGSK